MHRLLTLAAIFGLTLPHSSAITIPVSLGTTNLVNAMDPPVFPAGDPNGTLLVQVVTAAANYWQSIILDPGTLTITCIYNDSISGTGKFDSIADDGTRITQGQLRFRSTTNWYYDPTPNNHNEFTLSESLIGDFTAAQQAAIMNGAPPLNLEVEYVGNAVVGGAAANLNDLYTYALHEIGHALSMTVQLPVTVTEINDGDFDFAPVMINGATAAMLNDAAGGAHVSRGLVNNGISTIRPLMNTAVGSNHRRLPSAADVLAIATCPNPGWSMIDLPRKDFLPGGSTDWNTAGNWIGNRLPKATDEITIRLSTTGPLLPSVFPVNLSADAEAGDLLITDFSVVSTGANKLDLGRTLNIVHDGDPLDLPGAIVNSGGELETVFATLEGTAIILDGGLLDIDQRLDLVSTPDRTATVRGFGTIDVMGTSGGPISFPGELRNNGVIAADGGLLTLQTTGGDIWDLDGTTGDGAVLCLDGSIAITAGELADPFGGSLRVGAGQSFAITEGWVLSGTNATISLEGGAVSSQPASIGGGTLEFISGDLAVSGFAQIGAPITFANNAALDIVSGAQLRLTDSATFRGGSFSGDGTLSLDSTVEFEAPITLALDKVDLDGFSGNTVVNIEDHLTIDTTSLDTSNSRFNGQLNLDGADARFTLTTAPDWEMAGAMNIDTGGNTTTSLQTPPLLLSGTASIDGMTTWDARTTLTGAIAMDDDDDDQLTLVTGGMADPNRIENGSIGSLGALRLDDQIWLAGSGTIGAQVDLGASSGLVAEGGILELSRPPNFPDTATLGTSGSNANLRIVPAWTLPGSRTLSMDGGQLTGSALTLASSSNLVGHGVIATAMLNNERAELRASGGELIIHTGSPVDLDGSASPAGATLQAIDGDLTVRDPLTDAFGGEVFIGKNRTLHFDRAWGSTGDITLSGSAEALALLTGPGHTTNGTLTITGGGRISNLTLASTSTTDIAAGGVLYLTGTSRLFSGAAFANTGAIEVAEDSVLILSNGASLTAPSTIDGELQLGSGTSIARPDANALTLTDTAALELDIAGTPSTTSWDRLTSDSANLDGTLRVNFRAFTPTPGDTWQVVKSTTLAGSFDQIEITGLPPGMAAEAYTTTGGVFVKTLLRQSYATWSIDQNFSVGESSISKDPDGDGFSNGIEAFLGTDPKDASSIPTIDIITIGEDAAARPAIRYRRHGNVDVFNLSIDAQHSTDLETWTYEDIADLGETFDPLTCERTRTLISKLVYDDLPRQALRLEVTVFQ